MKQKFFILIYTLSIVAAVSVLYLVVTTIQRTPAVPPSAAEVADVSIGQYTDRVNANVLPVTSSGALPILSAFMSDQNAPASGCSIRFSLIPARKAVEPHGMIAYTLTLANQGNDTCQNVSLSDYYTDKEHFISSNPTPTASDYYWSIGNMVPGASKKIEIVTEALVGDGDQIESNACATADNSKDVCTGNVVFVERGASVDSPSTSNLLIQKVTGSIWGQLFGQQKEFGIWVWDSPIKMTPAQEGKVIQISKQSGFNVIYVTIDDYLPITQIQNSTDRANKTSAYMQSLATFITAAHAAGIQVDVVGGDKDWAQSANRWKGFALIDFVNQYNRTHPGALIRGFQYDVEPYLLSDYESNKNKELAAYVEFIDQSVTRMQNVPAQFSIVIPHFYDDVQNWTPPISYKGKNQYTFNHLLDILQRKPNSEIIIMAYRNFFDNNNGSKQISEVEVSEATKGKYSTKIIVAQETGDVSPSYVTFNDYPKSALFDSLNQITTYFGRYPNFGGTAVHYFDSFVKLQ